MRLRIAVSTRATEIPWDAVLAPGRPLLYGLLAETAPALGGRLHDRGWGPYGMVPFGHSAPVFPAARHRRGVYVAGGDGFLELGSPLPDVVEAWAAALAQMKIIDWGGVALHVRGVSAPDLPDPRGRVRLRASTPVVMKGSGRDESGRRVTRQAWVLPGEPEYGAYLAQNLRRKAETLGLDPDIELDQVTWVGPKRSFAVKTGHKPGAAVEVDVSGSGEALAAVRDWGLGQANSAGMGWVGTWT